MAATSRCWTVNAVSWRSNVLVHPNAFYSILTMTGKRASSFERHGATCPSHLVHPVPRRLARTRRAMTSVAAWRKFPVFVKMLFCFLREPRTYPVDAICLGQSAQSLYCCPVSCRCSVEWVSGQDFFARRQREGREGPLRNRRLRRSGATSGAIKCFQQPRTAVSSHRCGNPPRSPIQNRWPSGPEVQAQRVSVVFVVLRLASVLKLKTE